jgi:AraC-like DNA-binding protein
MRPETAMESRNDRDGVTPAARGVAAGFYVDRMLQSLRALGVDVARICRAAGIDRTELSRPGVVVPVERLCELVQAALERTRDDHLGLHLAEQTGPVGLVGYLCRASATVGDSLEAFVRFLGVALSSAEASLDARGDQARLTIDLGPGPREVTRHALECVATLVVTLLRETTAGAVRVIRVEFPHAPGRGNTLEYRRLLGCDVRFEQPHCAVVLPRASLSLRSRQANPAVARALREALVDQLVARTGPSLAARVAAMIRHCLAKGGAATKGTLAQTQGLSARSLQRRLQAEGVSLRVLRRDTQLVMARDLLASSKLTIKEIAARVGFSGTAPFDRAFKAFHGISPQDFRHGAANRARGAQHAGWRSPREDVASLDSSHPAVRRGTSPRTTEGVQAWT